MASRLALPRLPAAPLLARLPAARLASSSPSTVRISCSGCRTFLYKYRKRGNGALVKCFVDRILKDGTAGDCRCPNCGAAFAREARIAGKAAHKIIGGKVTVRR
eukprot:PLAT14210.4.p2 GENE.PLAT14210.4~~PLAT14210.4.p2  ORF type:complete len:104 (+),score=33.15 PLAT14210.4:3-314(+)